MVPTPLPSRLRRIRRAARRYRRLLAALAAAGALWAGLRAVAPPPAVGVAVAVAARDLPAGAALSATDVAVVQLPPAAVPDGATTPPAGSVLAAPVRRGEPLTDVRLTRGLAAARPAGSVLVTVRTADPAATLAVRAGDRVDVLAGPASVQVPDVAGGKVGQPGVVEEATTLGADLLVVAVPGRPADDQAGLVGGFGAAAAAPDAGGGLLGAVGPAGSGPDGSEVDAAGVLILAANRRAAARIATATGTWPLSVVVVSR